METAFDFNEKFGTPKKLLCKNFNKIQISIHPDFSGIYLCYQEAFKSLKADLSILTSYPEIRVWKDPNRSGYTIANACQWHLYWSKNTPKNINLLVHSFPQDEDKIELLKKVASSEFIKFLSLMCAEKTGGFNLVNYRHSSGVYHEQETEDLHRRI